MCWADAVIAEAPPASTTTPKHFTAVQMRAAALMGAGPLMVLLLQCRCAWRPCVSDKGQDKGHSNLRDPNVKAVRSAATFSVFGNHES